MRLPGDVGSAPVPLWAVFDPEWYRSCHPDASAGSPEEILEWHLTTGQSFGHSPNRYFDEAWQRETWPGIAALIEAGSVASAFDAWCRGPHATRAPHWLFEPREYRARYPALTEQVMAETGFINLYHHYLGFGAAERRVGHALFDPAVYLSALDPAEAEQAGAMPFRHFLEGLETGAPERRTSVWFDNEWYRERYPEAAEAVRLGRFRSLLEHYLRNDRPAEFDPSPWFSEQWYLANNPGLAEVIGPNGFRNGFTHFRAHGLAEGRSPHPDLDLGWYAGQASVRADIDAGRAPDPLTHWITVGHPAGLSGRPPPELEMTEPLATAALRRRAAAVLPIFGRRKLDFSHQGAPSITAIITVSDDPDETMVSLISLRTYYNGPIELILIGPDPGHVIETSVMGATWLRFDTALGETAARDAGLICATADLVLLLRDGVELAPCAIDNGRARLIRDATIGAVGGRLIQPHGVLLSAGGIVWRDGMLTDYARDASPLAAEANFVRDTDFCRTAFLLVRRDILVSLPPQGDGLADSTHDAADLCARIWGAGYRVVYEPDAVAFVTRATDNPRSDGRAGYIAAHGDLIATRPEYDRNGLVRARSPDRAVMRILFIEDSIPLRRIGSGFVRSNDVLRAMVSLGAGVTAFPMRESACASSIIRAELPDAVEVMHEATAADLADHLAARSDYYDCVWIARTHNLASVVAALHEISHAAEAAPSPHRFADETMGEFAINVINLVGDAPAPIWPVEQREDLPSRPRIIVDTEAVTSVRLAERAALHGEAFDLEAALRDEFRDLRPQMDVVAVSDAEATLLRSLHSGAVSVLGHAIAPSPTPRPWDKRSGLLFVGAIHDVAHPNHDGLAWFVDEVLPLIERALRWETRLTVAGYVAAGVALDRFERYSRVTLRGAVAELAPLYDSHRVFVAPARFAAGIPYKLHEAAAFGLPAVTTSLLARQLGWRDGEAISAADVSDPAGFASQVVALYRDADLWSRMREAALAQVTAALDPEAFRARVAALLRL